MTAPVRKAARAVTAPFRGYFNEHFEMVKAEIREHRTDTGADLDRDGATWRRLAELEAIVAEQAHHHAVILARLDERIEQLADRVGDLEVVVRQLAAVVAAGTPGASE